AFAGAEDHIVYPRTLEGLRRPANHLLVESLGSSDVGRHQLVPEEFGCHVVLLWLARLRRRACYEAQGEGANRRGCGEAHLLTGRRALRSVRGSRRQCRLAALRKSDFEACQIPEQSRPRASTILTKAKANFLREKSVVNLQRYRRKLPDFICSTV